MSLDKRLQYPDALKRYQLQVRQSFELYLFCLYYFIKVALYSREVANKKLKKLRPTKEDELFEAYLVNNEAMKSLLENEALQKLFRLYKLEDRIDSDTVRLVYTEFAKDKDYKSYSIKKEHTSEEHLDMLLSLFKFCIGNEALCDQLEDNYPQWIDDKSLVIGAIKKNIKALPVETDFFEDYRPNKETTVDFGETLFKNVTEEDEELLKVIEPTLKNWDTDRVAVIDMILIKMALCELISFPTIPSKVTLNEFVEISKLYSTDKSKDFINGILDRLMKKLDKEGKIRKEGRGLID